MRQLDQSEQLTRAILWINFFAKDVPVITRQYHYLWGRIREETRLTVLTKAMSTIIAKKAVCQKDLEYCRFT